MFKYFAIVFLTLTVFAATDLSAQTGISTDQVIQFTVANNPQIKVSFQNIEYSKGSFRIARSDFNTNVRLTGQNRLNSYPSSIDDPSIVDEYTSWGYSLSASKKIGFGTIITPSIGVTSGVGANNGSAFINLTQPILRGLGSTYNMANLRVAELNISSQEHGYLFDASVLILGTLSSYVEYIAAQSNLKIQLESEASMAETVRQLSRLVELDAIPRSELIVSEANLANQRTSSSLARNRLALSQNVLATSMGLTLEEVIAMGSAPEDFPMINSLIKIDENYANTWYNAGLAYRHDYLATVNDKEASVIGLDFSKKGMLPRLNLSLGAGYNGIYRSEALDQYYRPFFSNTAGMNYNVGLTFDIAPRYDYEKGQRVQAMALNDAANANLEYLQLQIKKEIQQDCDQLKYLLGAAESVNQAVEFSEQALLNEKKKLELGVSTAFNVALMQNSYLNALERQNGLLLQLNQSILKFKHHTGTLLEATGNSMFTVNTNQLFILPVTP
jgi:outer membrane protein TolC